MINYKIINYKINHYQNTWILCGNTLLLDNAFSERKLIIYLNSNAMCSFLFSEKPYKYTFMENSIDLYSSVKEWFE